MEAHTATAVQAADTSREGLREERIDNITVMFVYCVYFVYYRVDAVCRLCDASSVIVVVVWQRVVSVLRCAALGRSTRVRILYI